MIHLRSATLAMVVLVAASNYLVKFAINDWLTWGAFTYPFTFMVTELMNRFYGPAQARQVVYRGFVVAILASFLLADPRIAMASSLAFLLGQLLDISVFNRLRRSQWWVAPLSASVAASVLDTVIFFFFAFYGTEMDWRIYALGDFSVKCGMDLVLLLPFRIMLWRGIQGSAFKTRGTPGKESLLFQ